MNYRNTPHFGTCASPARIIFRDGYRSNLTQKSLSDHEINTVKIRDQSKRNWPIGCFQIDDCVLVRNYKYRSKFDPYFLPEKFCVVDILSNGNTLLTENTVSGLCLQRHPNDIKLFNGSLPPLPEQAFKMILHMTKIYAGKMLLILLPKRSTPIMTNPI